MKSFRDYFKKGKEVLDQIGYGKAVLFIAAGIVLIFLSMPDSENVVETGKKKEVEEVVKGEENSEEDYVKQLETRFREALKEVEGVGKVQVMITLDASSETILNKDEEQSSSQIESDEQSEQTMQNRQETVMCENEEGAKSPYVVKKIKPQIAGIVVVCEGGDQQYVINEITSAAEVLFSVSAHKVKVMKKNS